VPVRSRGKRERKWLARMYETERVLRDASAGSPVGLTPAQCRALAQKVVDADCLRRLQASPGLIEATGDERKPDGDRACDLRGD